MDRHEKTRRAGEAGATARADASDERGRRIEDRVHTAALVGLTALLLAALAWLATKDVTWCADDFTDMNVLMSGENFARQGFFRLRFLPVHFVGDVSGEAGYYTYYTHYPPLPNLLNGLLRVIGISGLWPMRMVCGSLMIVGLLGMRAGFAPIIGRWAAWAGMAFVGISGFYAGYCVSLHHTLNFFFLGLFFAVFLPAVHRDDKATRAWLSCWAVLMLASLTSFEFVLYAQAFAWVYAAVAGRLRARWPMLILLGSAPAVGFVLHYGQVVWALGWAEAMRDNLGFTHIRGGASGLSERWNAMQAMPDYVKQFAARFFFSYYPLAILPLLAGLWAFLAHRRKSIASSPQRLFALLAALAAGSATWYFAMPYHTIRHIHTAGQMLPAFFAVMGGAYACAGRWLLGRTNPPPLRFAGLVCLIVLAVGQLRPLARQFPGRPHPNAIIAEAIGPDAIPPDTALVTNEFAGPYAYFLRRPIWQIPNLGARPPMPFPESIPTLQRHLPPDCTLRYYLFASWSSNTSMFDFLARNCPGRKFSLGGTDSHLVLFDIANLHLPPEQRAALDPALRDRQLRGEFEPWDLKGFAERFIRARSQREEAKRPPADRP